MSRRFHPVAVVAATCLLPGAPTLPALWRLFEAEGTAITKVPAERLDRSVYYSADPRRRNSTSTDTAALLGSWDFTRSPKLPPRQLRELDPTHRMAIEVGQRIVDDLEDRWLPRGTTGVWVGNTSGAMDNLMRMVTNLSAERWARHAAGLRPDLADRIASFRDDFRARHPHPREDGAISGNILSGRIANYFDLRGPQMSLDAACASSMAALRAASMALESGTVDMALVASIGVQSVGQLVVQSKAQAIAPGPSFPFDRNARGFVPGEGAIMVALVRAEDAEAHGLPTLGVIRSIGASLNGADTSAWSPSEAAERLAITRAWDEGEFSPDGYDGRVDYIEAHGTATQVGDRVEHAAMLATYGKAPHEGAIPFGSVKSVVGHLVEGAGLAGVLRALYVFDTGRLPANVGVDEPADYVSASADRLRLVRHGESIGRDDGRPRRVAVSSFGVGGVNYHAILESRLESPAVPRRGLDRTPVAVVGLSAIMPGANDADAVWAHLRDGTAVRRDLGEYIPDFDLYHQPDGSRRDRTVCPTASIVDTPVLRQPLRWRVVPKRVAALFPDHILLLNAAADLAETGVLPASPEVRARSGIYVTDVMDGDGRNVVASTVAFELWWSELRSALAAAAPAAVLDDLSERLRRDPDLRLRDITEDDSMAGQGVQGATRAAAGLGLDGHAVAVNSACASGLAALDIAMAELRAGSLDFALVGGASLAVDEVNQVALSAIGSLSASGVGRPYDERADGFIIGSGAVWFALKRLPDAERDGDRVLAVIRECVGSSDGRGKSLLAPSRDGRREAIRRVFDRAGLDPRSVQYVEGHGAANVLGDASELEAIGAAMGTPTEPVRVGSVKGNYGHLKGPAALAGLLKVVLALRARTLVPTPGFARNAELPNVDGRLVRVVSRREPWPENGSGAPRRASVNAFGLGGTNYHVVLDEYPADRTGRRPFPRVGAATATALAARLRAGDEEAGPGTEWRAAVFARDPRVRRAVGQALAGLLEASRGGASGTVLDTGGWTGPEARRGPIGVLFPGQAGADHFDTVAWLCSALPDGADVLRGVEDVLGEPGRRLAAALRAGSLADLGDLRARSGTSQLLGLLGSYLTVRRLRVRHVPLMMLGHSAGEFSALVAADSLGLTDAVRLVWQRGVLAERAAGGHRGLMAAVFAPPDETERLLAGRPDVFVSTVNGPRFCVVGGWADPVRQVMATASAAGIESTELDIGLPFHTPLLAGAVPELRAALAAVDVRPPRVPVYSAVLGDVYPADASADTIRDCVAALYTHPVRLDQLIRHAAAAGVNRFVECGAGRSLSRSVGAVLAGTPHLAVSGVLNRDEGLDRVDAACWVTGIGEPTEDSGSFRVCTPVALPANAYPGLPWSGTAVVVAAARGDGLAGQLAQRLTAAGAQVEEVDVAELVAGTRPGVAHLPVERLAARLGAAGGPRWLAWVSGPGPEPFGMGVGAVAELSCLRAAVRGLADGWAADRPGGLVLVTSLDGRLGDSLGRLDPAGGALAGFGRALSREYPQAAVALLDVGRHLAAPAAAARIASLGRPPAGHHDIGATAGDLWASRLAPLAVTQAGADEPDTELLGALRESDAVVVVTGGTTGIVARVMCAAAEQVSGPLPGRLLLVSRTAPGEPLADPDGELERLRGSKRAALLEWRRTSPSKSLHAFESHWRRLLHAAEGRVTLSRLRARGIDARHVALDVRDGREVRAFAERLRLEGRRIRTLLHGAGVERSSRITEKPPAEWEATVAVKVLGLHHMVEGAGKDLRLMIAYGSLSGSLGLPGQTDYSAANEYLAKAVLRLRAERPGLAAQYVGWPAWDQVGMAAEPGVKRKLEGAMGLRYLDPDAGAEWALRLAGQVGTLPAQLVLLPEPAPPLVRPHLCGGDPPARRWWLVDTVTRHDAGVQVRRCYDTADPRDAELGAHRVRGNIRVAAVQIIEQFAEAYAVAQGRSEGPVELRDVVFHQGLVTARSGRRPTVVDVAADPGGGNVLRLSTVPLLRGDLPGPGSVLLATATVGAEPLVALPEPVDVDRVVPAAAGPDLLGLAGQFGISYAGRFATEVKPAHHPDFDVAGAFQIPPPAPRAGAYLSDPAAVDVAVRTVVGAALDHPAAGRGLPRSVARVVLFAADAPDRGRYAFVRVDQDGGYDVTLTDHGGRVLARLEGLRLQPPSDQPSPVATAGESRQ